MCLSVCAVTECPLKNAINEKNFLPCFFYFFFFFFKKQNKTTTSYWSHEIQLINIADEATIKLNHDLGAALGKNKQWCIYANIQKTLKINK